MSEYWILCPLQTVADVLTRKGLCESVSDHPLWTRHHLSLSHLPPPTPPTPTSPIAFVSTHLSVPSYLDPLGDHNAAGCGFKGTRDLFGKGSSQSLSGSRGQGHHQHQHQRSQPGPHQPARRQKDPGHSQGTPIVRGSATRGRHHLGISLHFIQPVLKTCWPIRKSSAPGRTQV